MIKIFKILFVFLTISQSGASAQDFKIIDKPIIYDSVRIKLSLEYLLERHGIVKFEPKIEPIMIVLHWTAANTMSSTFNAFKQPTLARDRKAIAGASNLNVSSQFLIDRDGSVYR